ncbi:MAG: Ig-like domain-containing protein [Hymenobacteraceae bacterium]|nr:Ig-like domain-containing protein [Hymenobacteraceae bacterium]
MSDLNKIAAVLMATVISACAAIRPPEGGPKDETPPKLLSSQPENLQVGVNTQTIKLRFDEPIQVKDIQRQLLITPDAGIPFKTRVEENELELIFEKPLEENVTYTIQFRDAIQDITESNKAEKIKLTFSTGAALDSGRVGGKVVRLLQNTPEANTTIALYPATDTGNIKTTKPYYIGSTDATGNFQLENIKEGNYRIYALTDLNNNLLFNQDNELLAYINQPISVTAQTPAITLKTVRIDTKKPYITKTDQFKDQAIITLSEGIRAVEYVNDSIPTVIGSTGAFFTVYNNQNYTKLSLPIVLEDSSYNRTADTLRLNFTGKPALVTQQPVKINKSEIAKGEKLTIEFETPVTLKGTTPITVVEDSAQSRKLNYPQEIAVDKAGKSITVTPLVTAKKALEIRLDSTQIIPVTNERISYPPIKLNANTKATTGSLSGTVTTAYKNYEIQLLNAEGKVVERIKPTTKFKLPELQPGVYTIRVLIDENNNGRWEGGDPELQREPEKVFFYPQPIDIRANWDLEAIELVF